MQSSNPVDTRVGYGGTSSDTGTKSDPMLEHKIGGVNVFGGGLALYSSGGKLLGGLGVSGDSSCEDHNVAWKVRHQLNLDNVPKGINQAGKDNVIYDIRNDASKSGWGHPECSPKTTRIAEQLEKTHPIGPQS